MKAQIILGSIGVAFLCVIWDLAIRPFVPIATFMEPLLATVVVLTLLQKRQASWIIAVLGALSFDSFRLGSWPWFTIFICVYVLVLQLLVTHVLTNRSFYSAFSLLAVGRLAGWLILWLSHESIALWPAPLGLTYGWKGVIFQLVLDAIWILLWYLIVSYWARRGPARYAQPKWFA